MSRKSVVMEQNGPKFNFSYRGKSLVPTDYLSLSVQGQFGVIWCISSFWQPCIYFWLKYSETFVLLRLNITVILLTSKSPSRVWRSLGFLLFNHVYMDVDPSRILLGVIYILLYVIMYAYSCWLSIMHERCRWKKKDRMAILRLHDAQWCNYIMYRYRRDNGRRFHVRSHCPCVVCWPRLASLHVCRCIPGI